MNTLVNTQFSVEDVRFGIFIDLQNRLIIRYDKLSDSEVMFTFSTILTQSHIEKVEYLLANKLWGVPWFNEAFRILQVDELDEKLLNDQAYLKFLLVRESSDKSHPDKHAGQNKNTGGVFYNDEIALFIGVCQMDKCSFQDLFNKYNLLKYLN